MFIKWCVGYVRIRVSGKYPERFLNICVKNDIELWKVERISDNEFVCFALLSNLKALKHSCTRSKCDLEILEKKGLLYLFKGLIKRKMFIAGLLFAIVLIYVLNLFIWRIQFSTEYPYDITKIEKVLEENKIKVGCLKNSVNVEQLQTEILAKCPELTWVNIEKKGMILNIKYAIGKVAPDVVDFASPCDIIAEKTGIIKSFNVRFGDSKIQVGDLVQKGDILVSGNTYGIKTGAPIEQVHAVADIYANTWYDVKCLVENVKYQYTKSGKFVKIRGVGGVFGNVDLFGEKQNFGNSVDEIDEKAVYIPFTKIKLVSVYTKTVFEVVRTEQALSDEEALIYSREVANTMLEKKLPRNAVIDSVDEKIVNDAYGRSYICLVANCTEKIGIEQKITEPLPSATPTAKPAHSIQD